MQNLRFVFSILTLFRGHDVVSQSKPWNCPESYVGSLLQVDCSRHQKEIDVPKTLNPKAQILDLSYNVLRDIAEDAFAPYKKVVKLDLSHCGKSGDYKKFEADKCFLLLTKLEFLDLSFTCFPLSPYPPPRFPKTVREFKIEECDMKGNDLDVSDMESLETLVCNRASLARFPIINRIAPLRTLDVRKCSLARARYEQIAFLCELKKILFSIKINEGILNPDKYCECAMMKKWLTVTKVNMPTTLTCGNSTKTQGFKCDELFSYEAAEARRQCLTRLKIEIPPDDPSVAGAPTKDKMGDGWWLLVVSGLLVLVLVVIAVSVIFLLKREENEEQSSSSDSQTNAGEYDYIEEEESSEMNIEPQLES